ncbi:metallophosphoesterase family protein [Cohnella panacarvi]|uniref:metallophosphoesterase family protein n=1 Tax=Cohnella panacarvi TaxID=400776 RepID=UPI00055429E3|nr:YfcE family phosphodiesterase [Cohnella panacarvi]
MKIVVISDTHMPRMNKKLPDRLIAELADADAILHAGDWTSAEVYLMLSAYAPTYGVSGNNDGLELRKKFGLKKLLKLGGCMIGLIHGHGTNKSIATETRAVEAFRGQRLDMIVYGHSHTPVLKRIGKTLVLNPGSPTDKRRQPQYSFAIVRIDGGKLDARLVAYDDKS